MRPAHLESRLELADVGRLARRLLRRAVTAARTEDAPVQRALWEHLMRLYQHDLVLDLASPEAVIAQTEGVTASFLKELLRRAAMYAAEEAAGDRGEAAGGGLTVRDAHMNAALDELLDSRNQLTRILLGGYAAAGPPGSPNPVTP
jgi:hypothetical protein